MTTKTILAADDDHDFLKIEGQFLTHAGYSVIYARDAYQAVHFALTQTPHLLLLDIHMPAGEGLSVQERIRNTPALKNTPVIYVTGERSDRVKIAARDLGAFAILYKPFDFPHLLATVHAALNQPVLHTARAGQQLQINTAAIAPSKTDVDQSLNVVTRL